jgi:adenosylhomocysteine nucleosidase
MDNPSMETEFKDGPIGILTSVRQEMVAIARLLNPISLFERNGVVYYHGEIDGIPVILTRSGMGWERARRAAMGLMGDSSPKSLIIAGFAASLSPSVKRGDIILPDCVQASQSLAPDIPSLIPSIPPGKAIHPPHIHIKNGGLITHDRIVIHASEKHAIAGAHPNCASMDMESYPMAREAVKAKIPWIIVRGITDDFNEDMPLDFNRYVGANGETSLSGVAMAACLRFWKIPAMIGFGKNAQKTADKIADTVKNLIPSLA